MKWWFGLAWLFRAALPGSSQTPDLELVQRSQPLLGTFVVVTAYGPDRAELQRAVSAAFAEVGRVDRLMSVHRPDSELARLNARAGVVPVEASPELFHVVEAGQVVGAATGGSFDLTIGPVAELWGFIWKEYRLPSREELAPLLPRVDFRLVDLDKDRRTIRFLRRDAWLDLGGIAKGYAVDRAVGILHSAGLTNVMVRAGGDLRVSGAPPGRAAWVVWLEDPAKADRRFWIELAEAAVSTSGDYENVFLANGRRYSHILDPRTGLPVEGIAACTLVAPTCLESDAWATACFVWGVERSLESVASRYPLRFVLRPEADSGPWIFRQAPSFPAVHEGPAPCGLGESRIPNPSPAGAQVRQDEL